MTARTAARLAECRPGSFAEAFYARLESIIERGKACGMTLTDICRQSGVARATPDRWIASTPKTIELVDEMEAVVAEAEALKAKGQ